jgi:hypothetical protein
MTGKFGSQWQSVVRGDIYGDELGLDGYGGNFAAGGGGFGPGR